MNRVLLLGAMGADVEVRTTTSGKKVGQFSLATSEKWVGKDGNKHEKTQWHRVVMWNISDGLVPYLLKGTKLLVEGSVEYRSWDDEQGNKKYSTEIICRQLHFCGGKKDQGSKQNTQSAPQPTPDFSDNDIPF